MRCRCLDAFTPASNRLTQGSNPERHEETRDAHGKKCGLPRLDSKGGCARVGVLPIPPVQYPAAKEQADARTDIDAARINRDRGSAKLGGEIIAQHRKSGGTRTRFSHAHANSEGGQGGEVACRAGQGSHGAPEEQPDGDQTFPRPKICQPGKRYAKHGIENGKHRSVKEADFRIRDAKVGLYLFSEYRKDLAIDEIEHVDDHQDEHRIPCVPPSDFPAARVTRGTLCLLPNTRHIWRPRNLLLSQKIRQYLTTIRFAMEGSHLRQQIRPSTYLQAKPARHYRCPGTAGAMAKPRH